jgi:cyclophilin family peptidyl-prolyl cis-trans isomerase
MQGGIAMRRNSPFTFLFFGVALLIAAGGCGSGDAPTASISGDDSSGDSSSGSSSQSDANREREARRQADLYPIVEVTTTAGTFKLKLDRTKAERTVDNFLNYVATGFYQGTVFHQVDKGFVVAAGGYTEQMHPKRTGVAIRNEAHNGLKNVRGAVAMVRSPEAPDTATSQFMINLADNPFLDHKSRGMPEGGGADQYGYCVFGEVVDGWDVIEQIAGTQVQNTTVRIDRPEPPAAKPVAATAAGQSNNLLSDTSAADAVTPAAPTFDEVTFEALPLRPIVIQSARRVQ